MLKRLLLALTLSLAALRGQASALPEGVPSQPTDPITDQAGMLSDRVRDHLNHVLRAVWDQGRGPQVAVLTLNSLNGRPIEDVSLSVARGWGLGGKETDNGVLLLIASNEHQLRFEVGTKLEGDLTDIASQRIISDVMKPLLRQGNSDGAVSAGLAQILERVAPQSAGAAEPQPVRRRSSSTGILRIFIYLVIFIIYIWLRIHFGWLRTGRRGIGGGWGGSGGGFGGGGFGGGGFSGGGGGFSGGGSSGSW